MHFSQAVVEKQIKRIFSLEGGVAALKLDSFYGTVIVRAADTEAITVTVTQSVDGAYQAEIDLRPATLDLRIERGTDGVVAVVAQFRRSLKRSWENWPPVLLGFEITIPRRCDLAVRTGDAQITVGELLSRNS